MIGALRTSYADAVRWMDQDAAYRRAREDRDANLDRYALRMSIGLDALRDRMESTLTGCWWDIGHGGWGAHDFDPSTGRCSNCGRSESYVAQAEAEAAR